MLVFVAILSACSIWESKDEGDYCKPIQRWELEWCQLYFDGCNTCVVDMWKITECTEKLCDNEETPYCIKDVEWYSFVDGC